MPTRRRSFVGFGPCCQYHFRLKEIAQQSMKNDQTLIPTFRNQRAKVTSAYPFTAIVGQDEMKLALILNVVDPSIGGVLIMGHRGSGKSTAVRALAQLLPDIWVVAGCPYHCDPGNAKDLCSQCEMKRATGQKLLRKRTAVPVIDLPLGATEDRVCGTIDIESALKLGMKRFEPGLLAQSNRGFLYIDEVNLLEDHLVDLLLDVAVTARNKVEREGISFEHPARFVLIGSGNPEEGELRPQLLDRFGLHVEVKTENDLEQRVEILKRQESFAMNRVSFVESVAKEQQQLQQRIIHAQQRISKICTAQSLLHKIAEICSELEVDGHRGDLTIARAARALASFEGRRQTGEHDVKRVAVMSLRHRLRRDPLAESSSDARIQEALKRVFPSTGTKDRGEYDSTEPDGGPSTSTQIDRGKTTVAKYRSRSAPSGTRNGDSQTQPSEPHNIDAAEPDFELRHSTGKKVSKDDRVKLTRQHSRQPFSRIRVSGSKRGRYTRAVSRKSEGSRLAADATLRAAILRRNDGTLHLEPEKRQSPAIDVSSDDLRFKRLSSKSGSLFIFLIDTSGSMALNRIKRAKAAALGLLRQSYLNRDNIAIIVFRDTSAALVLPPSRSILRARRVLDSLIIGGGTPLSAGLLCTIDLANRAQQRSRNVTLFLFTDGRANVPLRAELIDDRDKTIAKELALLGFQLRKLMIRTVIVDTQNHFSGDDATTRLAEILRAQLMQFHLTMPLRSARLRDEI